MSVADRIRLGALTAALPVAAGLMLSTTLLLGGVNTDFGQPLMCVLMASLAAVLLLAEPPGWAFWRDLMPVLCLVTAAIVWASAPDWADPGSAVGRLARSVFASMPASTMAPDRWLDEVLGRVAVIAALIAGRLLARSRIAPARFADTMLVLGVVNILVGLLVVAPGYADAWDVWERRFDDRFTGTLSNANVEGVYCGVLALLALSRAVSRAGGAKPSLDMRRILLWLVVLLAFGACLLTQSRAAIAATSVVMTAIAGAPLIARGTRRTPGPLLAIMGIALLLAVIGVSDLAIARFHDPVKASLRPLMVRHYAALAREAPLFGYGPGSFPTLNLSALGDPRQAQALWTVNSPHDFVLGLMLQGGVPYLVLIGTAGLLIAWRTAEAMRRQHAREERRAFVGGTAIVLGCSLLDIALDVPAVSALAALMIGLAWGYPVARSASSARTSRQRSSSGT